MANDDHVKRAGYAIGVWNGWRDEHPEIVPDLSGADLSAGLYRDGKLFGANLKGTDFRGSNMRNCDLHQSDLETADLSKSDLRGANLSEAKLAGSDLKKATLLGANLKQSDLRNANLEKAQLDKADLTAAQLGGAILRKTDLGSTAGLTQEQIDGAVGDSTTDLPPGLQRPSHWKKETPQPE